MAHPERPLPPINLSQRARDILAGDPPEPVASSEVIRGFDIGKNLFHRLGEDIRAIHGDKSITLPPIPLPMLSDPVILSGEVELSASGDLEVRHFTLAARRPDPLDPAHGYYGYDDYRLFTYSGPSEPGKKDHLLLRAHPLPRYAFRGRPADPQYERAALEIMEALQKANP